VLHPALGGELAVVTVHGPLGEPVPARVLVSDRTAYVEAAEAVGLHLVAPADRDPAGSSTEGVGELLAAAVGTGAARVVVGVGGTATTDGGRGMVDALDGLDVGRTLVRGVELVAATATDAPLMGHSGAAHGFAGGKGADRLTRDTLETSLREWATATDGGLAVRPGAGAGGGIGFGLLLLGAERVNGTQLVADLLGLDDRVRAADLAVTGQAVFDWEALRGRVVVAVASAAQRAGRPTVVLAERVEVGRRELSAAGIDAAYAVEDAPRGPHEVAEGDAPHPPEEALAALAARVARTWSR
jgi:glycerate kinase